MPMLVTDTNGMPMFQISISPIPGAEFDGETREPLFLKGFRPVAEERDA